MMEILHIGYGINDIKPLPNTKRGKRRVLAKRKAITRKCIKQIEDGFKKALQEKQ